MGRRPPLAAMRSTAQRTAGCTTVRGFEPRKQPALDAPEARLQRSRVQQPLAQAQRAVAERVGQRDDAV